MASPRNDAGPQLSLAGLRVILWILVGVSVLFTGVAWLVHPLLELADPVPADRLLAVLALFALLEYVGFRVVARALRPAWVEAAVGWTPDAPVPQAFVTRCLLGATLTTSIGFFAGIVVLMTGSTVALALATAAVGALLIQQPDVGDVLPDEPTP